jgi:hypothetical protein
MSKKNSSLDSPCEINLNRVTTKSKVSHAKPKVGRKPKSKFASGFVYQKCPKCKTLRLPSEFGEKRIGMPFKTCESCRIYNVNYYKDHRSELQKYHVSYYSSQQQQKKMNKLFYQCTIENIDSYTSLNWIQDQLVFNDFKCPFCKIKLDFNERLEDSNISILRKDKGLPNLKTNCLISCCSCYLIMNR